MEICHNEYFGHRHISFLKKFLSTFLVSYRLYFALIFSNSIEPSPLELYSPWDSSDNVED